MSNVRPVIEIDVQDDKFRRFYELFSQYSAEVGEQADEWRKLGDAMGEATGSLEGGALSGKDALALAAAQATVIAEAIHDAAGGTQKLEGGVKRSTSAMDKLRKGAEGVAGVVKSIAGGILHLAEFAGLGGLLGGFGIGALAGSAFNRFKSAGQLGLTPGQLSSFQVNAQQVLGTSALEAAANAQIDASKGGLLATLGIDSRRAANEDTGDLAFELLRAARKGYLSQPKGFEMQSPAVQNYLALGGSLGDLRNAALNYSDADLVSLQRTTRADAAALGFDRATARSWATLKIDLDKAGVSIETSLIKGLAPLAPQLGDLAKSISDLITGALGNKQLKGDIEDAAVGIEKLAKYLETVDWNKVGQDIAAFAADIAGVVKWLHDHFGFATPDNFMRGTRVVHDTLGFDPKNLAHGLDIFGHLFTGKSLDSSALGQGLKGLRGLFTNASGKISDAWKFLNSPITGPAAAAVIGVAEQRRVDPLLALATAMNESGLRPRAVGDSGHSLGLFQLNDQGEGAGMSDDQRFDPKTNANVALSVIAQKLRLSSAAALNEFSRNVHKQYALMGRQAPSHAEIAALAGTPGLYAAIGQRPSDPFAYARNVNDIYKSLRNELPGTSSHKSLENTIKTAMKKRTQKPATVVIYNDTASRVAVSANAAGLS